MRKKPLKQEPLVQVNFRAPLEYRDAASSLVAQLKLTKQIRLTQDSIGQLAYAHLCGVRSKAVKDCLLKIKAAAKSLGLGHKLPCDHFTTLTQ